MIQFVAALVMGLNAIRIGCDFPMWMQYSCIAYMVSFLVLFSDFYYKAYLAERREGRRLAASKVTDNHSKNDNGVKNDISNGISNGTCIGLGNGISNGQINE